MSDGNQTGPHKIGIVVLGLVAGAATVVGSAIAGVLIGVAASVLGLAKGEWGAWMPLTAGFYGLVAGIALGVLVCWVFVGRRLGVSRTFLIRVAVGLVVLIPVAEYAILKWPRITGPTTDASRMTIDAVSNDGNAVLLQVATPNSSVLYRVDTRTGHAVRLTTGHRPFEEGAEVSPDGKHVIFIAREDNGPSEIMLCDVDGSRLHPLLTESHKEYSPRFSHDGQLIYFARPTSPERYVRGFDIYSAKVDGTDIKQITHRNFGAEEWWYSFSLEAISQDESLALMKTEESSGETLLIYSLVDGDQPPLLIAPMVPKSPSSPILARAYFSSDTRALIFMAASQGTKGYAYDVYRMQIASRAIEKLTETDGYASDFRLSPDGENGAFFRWSSSLLNGVPIDPSLQLLNIRTRKISNMKIVGLSQ